MNAIFFLNYYSNKVLQKLWNMDKRKRDGGEGKKKKSSATSTANLVQ